MIYPRVLRSYDFFPVEIRKLDYYNLHNSSDCGKLYILEKTAVKHLNRKFCMLYIEEKLCCVSKVIDALNLDVDTNNTFPRDCLEFFSRYRFLLHPSDIKYLIKKDGAMGILAWTGDIIEELLHKISSSKDIAVALSSALNVIDKVNYCRYLPLNVILSRLKKYLQFITSLHNGDWENVSFRKQILDTVKVFVVRNDVYKEFITYCPLDLHLLLSSAQMEKCNIFNLWSDTEVDKNEATHVCMFDNIEHLLTFLHFGGRSSYSQESFEELIEWFGFDMESDDLKKFEGCLHDGHFVVAKFRVLQTIWLYQDGFTVRKSSVVALKWLWGSTTDPFLTYDDFMLFSVNYQDDQIRREILECWSWYQDHIGHYIQREPRRLMHLSRCAVRSRLARCFNLQMSGKLNLPPKIITYLQTIHVNLE